MEKLRSWILRYPFLCEAIAAGFGVCVKPGRLSLCIDLVHRDHCEPGEVTLVFPDSGNKKRNTIMFLFLISFSPEV
jgi:hypothetical protein